jgi:gliding motility-associated-like protein
MTLILNKKTVTCIQNQHYMKRITLLFLMVAPITIFSQTIYCLHKDSVGVSFGKINNLNGEYSGISSTICFDVFWSTYNPVKNQYIFKGQVDAGQPTSKLYTINANNGLVVNSLNVIEGNEGLRNFEFNTNDSLIYALSKDDFGVKLGTINPSNGVFTERSNVICFSSFWSALDSKKGYYILKGQAYPGAPASKLFTVDLKTGAIIQSIDMQEGDDGIKQMEYNSCDSTLYAVNKSFTGITIGKLDNLTGTYTPISQQICFNTYSATLVPSKDQIIIIGTDDSESSTIKLYTVNTKTGALVSQAIVGNVYSSAQNVESNILGCTRNAKPIQSSQNAFTPNNDGINDRFYPEELKGINNVKLSIFNRWGNLVYESNNNEQGWDGYSKKEPCPDGVYFWNASYMENNIKINKNGMITLIK